MAVVGSVPTEVEEAVSEAVNEVVLEDEAALFEVVPAPEVVLVVGVRRAMQTVVIVAVSVVSNLRVPVVLTPPRLGRRRSQTNQVISPLNRTLL